MRSHSWVYIDYIDYIGHILIVLLCCCYCVIVIVLLFLCYWNIGTFEHVISAFNILSAFTFLGRGFGFRTYRYINISIWFMLSEPNISLSYQKVTHWVWSVFNIWTLEFLNVWYLHSTSYLLSKFLSALTFLWHLASGIWHLASGIWHLASGIWHLASGIWHLASGQSFLKCERRYMRSHFYLRSHFGSKCERRYLAWNLIDRGILD